MGQEADVDALGGSQHVAFMFVGDPKARADLKAGTLYAVAGEGGWLYYGQVAPDKAVGFFRIRGRKPDVPEVVLAAPLMSVVYVAHPSITRALRGGEWKKLGRYPLTDSLIQARISVQWPVGTREVTVWSDGVAKFETCVDDPTIQDAEVIAVWDAQYHIPERLTADFSPADAAPHVGGPVWRERQVKEEMARRFPDQP